MEKAKEKAKIRPVTSSCRRCTGVCLSQLHSHQIKKRMEKRNRHGKEKKRAQEVTAAPALQLLVIIFSRADAGLPESSEC